jgi:SAM-dependent methyltransferase
MAVEVEIDVEVLKSEIKKTYASVSQEPEKDFIFPTGRSWAEDLGYPAELANVPETAVGSFAGVANPWQLGWLSPGERVLDLGSGAGTDSLVAAQMVGKQGHVTGIDMTPEMLTTARAAASEMGAANVELVESEAEQLPFADASLDVVISNGVIDLIPDKDAVFISRATCSRSVSVVSSSAFSGRARMSSVPPFLKTLVAARAATRELISM